MKLALAPVVWFVWSVTSGASALAASPDRMKLEKACQSGKAQSCIEVATMWAEGDRGPVDDLKALGFFQKACDLDEPLGCHEAARYYDTGVAEVVKADLERALRLYDSACNGGYLESCRAAAGIYSRDKRRAPDPARARATFEKACALGDGPSCYDHGLLLQKGEGGPVDLGAALRSFVSGCDAQDARGCMQAGMMHKDGFGTSVDPKLAAAFFEKACSYGGPRFCGAGDGEAPVARCGPGGADSDGCLDRAIYSSEPGLGRDKLTASRTFFEGKCKDKDAGACFRVAWLDAFDDKAKGRAGYEVACGLGSASACVNLGKMLVTADGGAADVARARELFGRGCDGGDGVGCGNAGALLASTTGGPRDDKAARGRFEKGCEMGEGVSCFNAAVMHAVGLGGGRDSGRAKALLTEGCQAGHQPSCKASVP